MQKENMCCSKKSMSCRKAVIRHLRIFVSDGVINGRKRIRRSRSPRRTGEFRDDSAYLKGGGPGFRPSGAPLRSGFTLIELLVVVLIIGILTAVALPQYRLAVEKARMTEALVALKQIKTAQENYFLANGVRANTFEELAFEWPGTKQNSGKTIKLPSGVTVTIGAAQTYVYAENKTQTNTLVFHYAKDTPDLCHAKRNDTVANQVCKSLGGTHPVNTSDCTIGACTVYALP